MLTRRHRDGVGFFLDVPLSIILLGDPLLHEVIETSLSNQTFVVLFDFQYFVVDFLEIGCFDLDILLGKV